jgi:hypothetical protein
VAGWRAGDRAATAALARLELDELGLRVPAAWAQRPGTS